MGCISQWHWFWQGVDESKIQARQAVIATRITRIRYMKYKMFGLTKMLIYDDRCWNHDH